MNAQPDVIGTIERRVPEKHFEAAVLLLEDQDKIIKGLRAQNARLAEERLQVELSASLEVAKAKFGQAQAFQRITELDKNLNDLRNWITGNVVQRDEFQQLRNDHDNLAYRVPV